MARNRVAGWCALVAVGLVLEAGCAGSEARTPPSATAAEANIGAGSAASSRAAVSKVSWGEVDGQKVDLYTLTNTNGLVMKVTNYGGIISELHLPDRDGKQADVVLGYDNLAAYVKATPYFGAIIGRVANRIKDAQFSLEGETYKLAANMGKNALHGGKKGWDKVVWQAEASDTASGPSIKLTYTSKDGEEGYPGAVTATNVYTLTNDNELKVEMSASTDKTTIVNMAHHSYWNLSGHASGTILDHEVQIYAAKYTPGDPETLVLGGDIKAVKGTPFDFTKPKPIGKDLEAAGGKPIGFDHNWIVDGDPQALRPVLRIKDPTSGRVMSLMGDQPGVQFYSGNFLDGSFTGKDGAVYKQYTGLCAETQRFPNSINVPAWQSQVILRPGQVYRSTMIHRFSVE